MNRLIAGLLLFVIGLWMTYSWWWFIADIIKGLFAVGLLIVGLILVVMGIRNFSGEVSELEAKKPPREKPREKTSESTVENSAGNSVEMSLEKAREKAIAKAREKVVEMKKA